MKILICGGRDLNEELVCEWLTKNFLTLFPDCDMIVHGGAKGADNGAHKFCYNHDFPEKVYKAEWDKYGNAAGPIRNEMMLKNESPDVILAFPGGRGTAHMKRIAKKAKKIVYEVELLTNSWDHNTFGNYVDCFED